MAVRFSEGDIFKIPLKSGKTVIGLLARKKARRPVVLGFFFRPPGGSGVGDLLTEGGIKASPSDAIFITRFADECLKDGDWPIIGRIDPWDRGLWPVPRFLNQNILVPGRASLITYSDDDPMVVSRIQQVTLPQPGFELDGSLGTGAVEFMLEERLKNPMFRK